MKAKFKSAFKNEGSSNTRFCYTVSGTEAELQSFKEAEGDYYTEDKDTGKPLWFSGRYSGDVITLGISRKGNVFVDNSEMEKLNSLAEQHPALRDAIAKQLLESITGKSSAPAVAEKHTEPTAEEEATEPEGEL